MSMARKRKYHDESIEKRTEIRKNTVRKFLAGKTIGELADETGVTRQTIYNWVSIYKKKADKGLEHRPRGPECALTPRQLKQLETALKGKATKAGFPDDRWTLNRITKYVLDRFGVDYAPRSLFHVLKKLDVKPLKRGAPRKTPAATTGKKIRK